MKVFIVDKAEETLDWLKRDFEDRGWEARTFLHPLDALQAAIEEAPDLFVVELFVPSVFRNFVRMRKLESFVRFMQKYYDVFLALAHVRAVFFGNPLFWGRVSSDWGGLELIRYLRSGTEKELSGIPVFVYSNFATVPDSNKYPYIDPYIEWQTKRNLRVLQGCGVNLDSIFEKFKDREKMLNALKTLEA